MFLGNTVDESLLLNTFCGVDMPPIIYSSGQYLRLAFKTDYSLEYTGFKMSYSSINSSKYGLTLLIENSYCSNCNCINKSLWKFQFQC